MCLFISAMSLLLYSLAFLVFFVAEELLFISLLSKVRPGSVIFITCIFRYYHLLCEFYLFSISCFFLSSLVLNSAQLQHVSSNLRDWWGTVPLWVDFNYDLHHFCCFRVYPWYIRPLSFGRRQLDKSSKAGINFNTEITVKHHVFCFYMEKTYFVEDCLYWKPLFSFSLGSMERVIVHFWHVYCMKNKCFSKSMR